LIIEFCLYPITRHAPGSGLLAGPSVNLVPGIHVFEPGKTWMAGTNRTNPAMTPPRHLDHPHALK
jgi:hypothetical protein